MQRSKTAAVALAFLAAMVTFQVGRPDDVVSTGDDLDGDSVPDEVAANPDGEGAGPSPGVVYVSSGEDGGLIVKFEGGRDGDLFGYAVHSSTDFDLDGFKDLIIGAPNDGNGRAYVFYGPFLDSGPLVITADGADLSFRSPDPDQLDFGYLVGPVTDLDCDGLPDIRIGSVSAGPGGGEGPGTFIVSGLTGEPLLFVEGDDPFDAWAPVTGDADGDADVDQSDIDLIVTNQGQQAFGAFEGDVNGDGVVDPSDIGIAQDHLGADGFSGMDVGICRLPCDDPPPTGWHCVVDCDGEPIELPENVWPECDPCIMIGGGCYVELYDGLMAFPQGSTIEVVPQTIIGGGEIDQWLILVGAERVEVLSGLSDIPLILRLDEPGPVTLRLDWQACFDLCGDEMTFYISAPGDWDGDGYSDICEQSEGSDWMDFFDVPGFPLEGDPDNDGLTNGEECSLGTDRLDYDSDGDGLPDGWEVQYGLDPLDEDSDDNGVADTFEDPDGDGLSNHDEFIYGSDPTEGDSDGDGVSDGDEVAQGSDPNDPSDEGIAPDPDDLFHGNVSIGDPSGSHSELWMLKVGDRRYKAPGYGEVICFANELFRRGESYQVQLVHLGSSLQPPDLDHIAWIDVIEDGECILLDDPDGTLTPLPDGLCSSEQRDYAPFRSDNISPGSFDDERATLLWLDIDLDVDSDNDGAIDDDDDQVEETAPGQLITLNNGDADLDGIPDFADGYDLDGIAGTDDDFSGPDALVPVIFRLAPASSVEAITFNYSASAPSSVSVTMGPEGPIYGAGAGALRLWMRNASVQRDPANIQNGGDWVQPGVEYTVAELGLDSGDETIVMWLEPVAPSSAPGDLTISVHADDLCSDTVSLTAFGIRLVGAADLEPIHHPQVTNASPVITLSQLSLQNLRPSDDNERIIGDLHVAGTLDDPISDLLPGPGGIVSELGLYVDGEPLTVLGSEEPVVISLTGGEISKSGTLGGLLDRYDFSASFSRVVAEVVLDPGWQQISVTASNSRGFTASVRRSFEVGVQAPPDDSMRVVIDYHGDHPYFGTGATADFWFNGVFAGTAELTSTKPGIYRNADSSIVIAGLLESFVPDPVEPDDYTIGVTHEDLGLFERSMLVTEVTADSLIFDGVTIVEPFDQTDWEDYAFELLDSTALIGTSSSAFNPFLVELIGPPTLLSDLADIDFAYDDPGQGPLSRSYDVSSYQGRSFLMQPDGGLPEVFLGVPAIDFEIEDLVGDRRDGAWNFTQGFGAGLGDTVIEIVDSVATIGKGVWYVTWHYSNLAVGYRLATGGPYLLPEDRRRLAVAWDVATTIADVVVQVRQGQEELIAALLAGDVEALQLLGEEYAVALECVVEMIAAIEDEIAMMDDYDAGRICGRIVGEVAVEVALAVATAGAGNAAKKSTTAAGVINKLEDADDVLPPGVMQRLVALGNYFSEMASSKMCFVAGTLVVTSAGLTPIETIEAGDRVLSRDAATGLMGWKPVAATFVTHPTSLHHLDHRGPQGQVSTLVCTGEHPIFVETLGRFVPAAELRAGLLLRTHDGRATRLLDCRVEHAAGGERFTTYNLEVEDWHTYFVGESGVWVHNVSSRFCEKAFGIYRRHVDHLGESPQTAFSTVQTVMTKYMTRHAVPEAEQLKHLGDVLTSVIRQVRGLADEVPVWTDGKYDDAAVNAWEHWLKHRQEFQEFDISHPVQYVERAFEFSELDPVPGDVRVGIARRPGPDNQPVNVRITARYSTREFSSREILPDGTLGPMRTHFRPEYDKLVANWKPEDGPNPYLEYDPSNVAGWLGYYFKKQNGIITELD